MRPPMELLDYQIPGELHVHETLDNYITNR